MDLGITILGVAVASVLANICTDLWRSRGHKLQAIEDSLDQLKDSFNAFVGDLMAGGGQLDSLMNASQYLIKSSPVTLSKAGEDLAKNSGITGRVNRIKPSYAELPKKYKDGIDLMNESRSIASRELASSEDGITEIKQYSYGKGLSQLLMQEIFAIKLKNSLPPIKKN